MKCKLWHTSIFIQKMENIPNFGINLVSIYVKLAELKTNTNNQNIIYLLSSTLPFFYKVQIVFVTVFAAQSAKSIPSIADSSFSSVCINEVFIPAFKLFKILDGFILCSTDSPSFFGSYHTHKRTRYNITCAVNSSNKMIFFVLGVKIKITTYNIFWFV